MSGLLRRGFLEDICLRYELDEASRALLFDALDELEQNDALLQDTLRLQAEMLTARAELDIETHKGYRPDGMERADFYDLLLLLSCVEPAHHRRKERGLPPESYENSYHYPLERQMKKLKETGDGRVSDFPWDMNFYTASIFRFGRFLILPFRLKSDIAVWRRNCDTAAFITTATKIRRDGLPDGLNGQHDPDCFETRYTVDDKEICGNLICPSGLVQKETTRLLRDEWQLVMQRGDTLLEVHIPGGEGYDPVHLRESICDAHAFYQKHLPEFDIKGAGSESWLYDPHLAHILQGRGNVCDMQKTMYVYPSDSGDKMFWQDLFRGRKPISELPTRTTMHRNAIAYLEKGGRFTTCNMFILKQDFCRIGDAPYAPSEQYEAAWQSLAQPPAFDEVTL